jgi:hypothetical protein
MLYLSNHCVRDVKGSFANHWRVPFFRCALPLTRLAGLANGVNSGRASRSASLCVYQPRAPVLKKNRGTRQGVNMICGAVRLSLASSSFEGYTRAAIGRETGGLRLTKLDAHPSEFVLSAP